MKACMLHKSQEASSVCHVCQIKKNEHAVVMKRFLRICSKEDLVEKAQDVELTIPVKKCQEKQYNPIQCLSL